MSHPLPNKVTWFSASLVCPTSWKSHFNPSFFQGWNHDKVLVLVHMFDGQITVASFKSPFVFQTPDFLVGFTTLLLGIPSFCRFSPLKQFRCFKSCGKIPQVPTYFGCPGWITMGKIWKNASKVDKPSIFPIFFPYFSHVLHDLPWQLPRPRLQRSQALKAPSHAPAPQLLRMPELGPNRREIVAEIVDFHYMGLSENSVPLHPMVLPIIIPTKWLFHWGYAPFSDIPISHIFL